MFDRTISYQRSSEMIRSITNIFLKLSARCGNLPIVTNYYKELYLNQFQYKGKL